MRIFVATRGYPSREKIYNHGFVHRRVLAYRNAGHDVRVFAVRHRAELTRHEWDGVEYERGSVDHALRSLQEFGADCIAAHAPADDFGALLTDVPANLPVCGWIYGSELMPFHQVTERADDDAERVERARKIFERRLTFWRRLIENWPERLKLLFVSEHAKNEAELALGAPIPDAAVSPSPIDTELFSFDGKSADQRFDVLSIRPFSDWRYANDLSVAAIRILSRRSDFERFRFRLFGEGRLFDQVLEPIHNFPNVHAERRFLSQEEVAAEHRKAGIFLCPSRDEAQGVSRDEAMSSGLVPVTTRVGAIPEFVDEQSGYMAEPEDAAGLAEAIGQMADDPALFLAKSQAAAERVRATLSMQSVIEREIAFLKG